MIAIAGNRGPEPPEDSRGKFDRLKHTLPADAASPSLVPSGAPIEKGASPPSILVSAPPLSHYVHTSLVGMSSPAVNPAAAAVQPRANRPAPENSSSSGPKGLWFVLFLIGTLIRLAIDSNHNRQPTAIGNADAMRQIDLISKSFTPQVRAFQQVHLLEALAKMDPQHATEARAARAWILATCPDPVVRNGKEAIQEATRAYRETPGVSATIIGTVAAAYAEIGDFKQAVEWQQKAQKAYTSQERAKWGFLLDLYKTGKQYREWPPDLIPGWPTRQPVTPKAAPQPHPSLPVV